MTGLLVALAIAVGLSEHPPVPEAPSTALVSELAGAFAKRLENPEAYARRVKGECRGFPEGDLFPYLFPLYGFLGQAQSGAMSQSTATELSERLLELAIPVVARRMNAPERDLQRLTGYGHQATYLCQLNSALGQYRLAGGNRYAPIHDHLTALIVDALTSASGRPLRSFPSYSWPFDTIPCLASVALHDRATGHDRAPALANAFFEWEEAHGTDAVTGLPLSRVEDGTGCGTVAPRGCDLSLRLVFLNWLAPRRARVLYRKYVQHMWVERFVAAGFAEWPDGTEGRADIDSGPIILGIGSAASTLGLAATRVAADDLRWPRLLAQAEAASEAVAEQSEAGPKTLHDMIEIQPGYVTGFLFGDAVLFFALAAPVDPLQ